MISRTEIERVARELGKAADAERVILFGSYARGDATEDSDVDLIVIAENDAPRHRRSSKLYGLLRPHPFPMDLVVYTPSEVEKGSRSKHSFLSKVLQYGKIVYARS